MYSLSKETEIYFQQEMLQPVIPKDSEFDLKFWRALLVSPVLAHQGMAEMVLSRRQGKCLWSWKS